MEERTCPVCQTEFTPTHHNQRFCPTPAGRRKSKCAKAYENAKHRGTLEHLIARDGRPGEPFDCAHCGRYCVPGRNVASHASRFCCVEHKAAWHSHHVEGNERRPAESLVLIRRDPFAISRWRRWCADLHAERVCPVRAHDVTAYRRALRSDPCAYCGGVGEALDHIDPRSRSGPDGWENRTSTCHWCNSLKGPIPLLLALLWVPVAAKYHDLRRILYQRGGDRPPPRVAV